MDERQFRKWFLLAMEDLIEDRETISFMGGATADDMQNKLENEEWREEFIKKGNQGIYLGETGVLYFNGIPISELRKDED